MCLNEWVTRWFMLIGTWLTIHCYSVTAKLVINYVNSASYLRVIYCHNASITCTGVTKLYVIDGEGKVVMELAYWHHRVRVWCGNGQTAIHPPNTVVLAQSSRLYMTIDGGRLSFLKGIGRRNREICFGVCYRRRNLRSHQIHTVHKLNDSSFLTYKFQCIGWPISTVTARIWPF